MYHGPLLASIAAAAISKITHFRSQELGMTLWSFSRLQSRSSAWALLARADAVRHTVGAVGLSALLMECE